MTQVKRHWLLAGLVGLAFALRVAGLDYQSLWRDEVDAIRFASRPLGDLFQTFLVPGQNGPLYHLVLRAWLDLAGRSGFVLRFFSVAVGTLAVPLVYRLGRRLFPSLPSVALLATVLTSTSPFLVWYSQEGKMYVLAVALVLLSMDRYLAALEQGGWHRWLLYVVVTSAAFYVHLLAALIIPAQVIVFLLVGGEVRKARWKPWLASMAALTAPYLPLLAWELPLLLEPGSTGYQFVPLHAMFLSLLTSYSLGIVRMTALLTVVPSLGLLLTAGLLWDTDRARWTSLGILLCWFLVPVLGLFFITLVRPMYTDRYLIFVLPAYLLLLAAGVVSIARRSRLLAGLLLAAFLIVNGWGVWLQARTLLKADFRAATSYVSSRMMPGDLILFQIPYGRHSFEYYYQYSRGYLAKQTGPRLGEGRFRVFLPLAARSGGQQYRWAEGLYTNSGMDLEEVDRQMAGITAGSEVVWLVATEVPLWDERGLVQAWLDEHATMTGEAQFVRVAVYRYEVP